MEGRYDHGIEFQALGFVNGHDLHGRLFIVPGQAIAGEQFFHPRIQLSKIDDVAAAGLRVCFRFEQIEQLLRVVEVDPARQARRAAQREPGAFNQLAQRLAPAQVDGRRDRGAQRAKPRTAVDGQHR